MGKKHLSNKDPEKDFPNKYRDGDYAKLAEALMNSNTRRSNMAVTKKTTKKTTSKVDVSAKRKRIIAKYKKLRTKIGDQDETDDLNMSEEDAKELLKEFDKILKQRIAFHTRKLKDK